ncbi:hypothetical protein [Limnoglobus roseus]|uniref:hypothetical protein n=1 Tax=Limnoglobus roseus TaxID=2598579 RepID=UPI00143D9128|nr:hypothetical protein [Limnoglobus roseus]
MNVPPLSQQKLDKLAAKEQRKAEIAARRATEQPASSEGSGSGWGFSWHWIWALAIIGRLAVALGGRGNSTPPPTYRPAYTPPVNTSRIPGFPQAGNKTPQEAAKELNDLREKADRLLKQKSSAAP